MEPIHVTANFNSQGEVTPLSFAWRGRIYRVGATGRQWQDEEGRHLLVMTESDTVYHLLFTPHGGKWYLLNGNHQGHYSLS